METLIKRNLDCSYQYWIKFKKKKEPEKLSETKKGQYKWLKDLFTNKSLQSYMYMYHTIQLKNQRRKKKKKNDRLGEKNID